MIATFALGTTAAAQSQIVDFTKPILALDTDGHGAPVRSLIFTPEDDQLLSAGLDKIINVWGLRGRPALSRTMRPAIWSGPRGTIYAMALSPTADAQGQRTLAVAGFGLQNQGGNIGLYRYPGLNHLETGDFVARLPQSLPQGQVPWGHTDTIMALAFSPDGRTLASAGNDGSVRLWEVGERRGIAVLEDHIGPVNVIAYAAGGTRLVTGGADGFLRLWDLRTNVLLRKKAPVVPALPNPRGEMILALAVSPDGRWIVVGREGGALSRYNAEDLEGKIELPKAEGQAQVEALAISHDGKNLVTSIVSHKVGRPDLPRVECDVELRAMPGGEVVTSLKRTTNLVYAIAFGPDDRRLAFAGNDTQAVTLVDLAVPARTQTELRGHGSSVWEVGFDGTSRVVGYARRRPDLPDAPQMVEGFDLAARETRLLDRGTLRRALTSLEGKTIRPTGPYSLDVVDPQGRRISLTLDRNFDRRWWSYTFVPSGVGHPKPTVAVGCEAGVVFFDAATGARTRLYAGHNGAIYTLAPSPDGRWLVSGGVDQTVRLWRLAGCDSLPPLGARFEQRPAGWTAVEVTPQGFAEGMGLKKGDLVKQFGIAGRPLDPKDLALAGQATPNTRIEFTVLRGPKREEVPLLTTRRDSPAVSLFPGLDGEWVFWMPAGYYDTSIAGDRKYLGWHRNGPDLDRPTDFSPIDVFERELRRGPVLDRLIETADVGQALAALGGPAVDPTALAEDGPPPIQIVEPARPPELPLAVQTADLTVRVQVGAADRRPVRAIRVLVDNRTVRTLPVDPPRPVVDTSFDLTTEPGTHRINVVAINDRDKERTEGFDVAFAQPRPPASRLAVLSMGVSKFRDDALSPIAFAEEDATDLEKFFGAPGDRKRFDAVESRVLVGPAASAEGMAKGLADIVARLDNGGLGRNDTVCVFLESHFLQFGRERQFLGSDAAKPLPCAAFSADELAAGLGRIADYGCTVVLFLDVVHRPNAPGWDGRVGEWVRELYRKRGVIVFLASKDNRPSQRVNPRLHGVFAQALLESHDMVAQSRAESFGREPLSLREFEDRVSSRVLELTGRKQHAGGYWSGTTSASLPILAPR